MNIKTKLSVVGHLVGHLSTRSEALSSNPSTGGYSPKPKLSFPVVFLLVITNLIPHALNTLK
jgi:hypothetical protein